jgi:hypothetical protein
MGLFMEEKLAPGMYHAPAEAADGALREMSTEAVERLANDPNCIEHERCRAYLVRRAEVLARRVVDVEARNAALLQANLERKRALEEYPFDPRTEVSADAKHIASKIVGTLWILFVLLPIALAILMAVFGPSH